MNVVKLVGVCPQQVCAPISFFLFPPFYDLPQKETLCGCGWRKSTSWQKVEDFVKFILSREWLGRYALHNWVHVLCLHLSPIATYVCTYVFMYICTYVCTHVFMYVHMFVHMHVNSDLRGTLGEGVSGLSM